MLKVNKNSNWRMYWGEMRLPQGAEALGVVHYVNNQSGALIKLSSGVYVRGNAGGIKNLPQDEVESALRRSEAAAALGSSTSPAKAAAAASNGARGGRPKGMGKKRGTDVITQ